jgi:hypothetical protein
MPQKKDSPAPAINLVAGKFPGPAAEFAPLHYGPLCNGVMVEDAISLLPRIEQWGIHDDIIYLHETQCAQRGDDNCHIISIRLRDLDRSIHIYFVPYTIPTPTQAICEFNLIVSTGQSCDGPCWGLDICTLTPDVYYRLEIGKALHINPRVLFDAAARATALHPDMSFTHFLIQGQIWYRDPSTRMAVPLPVGGEIAHSQIYGG